MMIRIQKAVPLEAYRLRVTFSTKEEGIFDMRSWVQRPAFSALRDEDVFRHVMIDDVAGTICWPNGIDLCPDVIYTQTQF